MVPPVSLDRVSSMDEGAETWNTVVGVLDEVNAAIEDIVDGLVSGVHVDLDGKGEDVGVLVEVDVVEGDTSGELLGIGAADRSGRGGGGDALATDGVRERLHT